MKRTYLLLTIIGWILPNIFVAKVSIATGNILLWTKPLETINGMFANDISTAFMLDLFFVVILFMIWTYRQVKKYQMKNLWAYWLFTFGFGIASGLPLFLYYRESYLNKDEQK